MEQISRGEIIMYGIFNEINFLNESNTMFEELTTPELIFKWMRSNIKYDSSSNWILKSPEEVYASKKGNCHDQAAFISKALSNINKKNGTLFFIEYNEKENIGGRTHTLVWYNIRGKIYWMETSWGGQEKIHGPFNDIKSLKRYIKELHEKEIQSKKYPLIEWGTTNKTRYGMNLEQYVDACLRREGE